MLSKQFTCCFSAFPYQWDRSSLTDLKRYTMLWLAQRFSLRQKIINPKHERRKRGARPPCILKISVKQGCFLNVEWEKNFTFSDPPGNILEKSPSAPPGKNPSDAHDRKYKSVHLEKSGRHGKQIYWADPGHETACITVTQRKALLLLKQSIVSCH